MIDVNDDVFIFKLLEYIVRVLENVNFFFNVIMIKVDDRDMGQFGKVIYVLDSLINDFRIVVNNGIIFFR